MEKEHRVAAAPGLTVATQVAVNIVQNSLSARKVGGGQNVYGCAGAGQDFLPVVEVIACAG